MRRVPSITFTGLTITLLARVGPVSGALYAQEPSSRQQPDHRLFACLENGLAGRVTVGCRLLARKDMTFPSRDSVYWQVVRVRSRRRAEILQGPRDVITEVDGRVWLFHFGAPGDTVHGRVTSIGPLPMPEARVYRVEAYYVVMPPRSHTVVHTHPGPEAWYV